MTAHAPEVQVQVKTRSDARINRKIGDLIGSQICSKYCYLGIYSYYDNWGIGFLRTSVYV